jgi:hypothetical protein
MAEDKDKAVAGAGQAEAPRGNAGDAGEARMVVGTDDEGKPVTASYSRPTRDERWEEDPKKRAKEGAAFAKEVNVNKRNNGAEKGGDENNKPAVLYRG